MQLPVYTGDDAVVLNKRILSTLHPLPAHMHKQHNNPKLDF